MDDDPIKNAHDLCDSYGYSDRYRKLLVAAVKATGRTAFALDNEAWDAAIGHPCRADAARVYLANLGNENPEKT